MPKHHRPGRPGTTLLGLALATLVVIPTSALPAAAATTPAVTASPVLQQTVPDEPQVSTAGNTSYTAPATSPFIDVKTTQVFYKEMSWLAYAGVSKGWTNPDGTKVYRPSATVTRDVMAAFLYRLAGSPDYTAPAVSPFTDVRTGQDFYKEMSWLASTGVSKGWTAADGTKTYQPYSNITRDQMAAFLYRLAGSPAYTAPAVSPFTDVRTGQAFYKEMSWMYDQGISKGWTAANGTKTYQPSSAILRDQMAAFMYRFDGLRAPLAVKADLPAEGVAGLDYLSVLSATGGTGKSTWTATGLPAGLKITADGVISGTPTTTGSKTVTVTATDALKASSTRTLTLKVPRAVPAKCIGDSCATLTKSSSTVEVTPAQVSATTTTTTGDVNTVTLADVAPAPVVDKVMVLPASSALPSGAAVRVKSVTRLADGRHRATVVPAKLDEAYPTGEIHIDGSDTAPAVAGAAASSGATGTSAAVKPQCEGPALEDLEMSATPYLTPQLDYKWGLGGPEYASVGYDGTIEVTLDATLPASLVSCEVAAPPITRAVMAGPVPVTFTFQPTLELSANAAGHVSTTMTFRCQTLYQYTSAGGAGQPQQHCAPEASTPELGDGNEANVELVGAVGMEVAVLRLAGFDGEGNTGVHATQSQLRNPTGELKADIGYEMTFCLGCVFDVAAKSSKFSDYRMDFPLASGSLWEKTVLTWNLGPRIPGTWVTYSTDEGYAFQYPAEWKVLKQNGQYLVSRPDGKDLVRLRPGITSAQLSGFVGYQQPLPDRRVSSDVPGLSQKLGRRITGHIGSSPGQYPGGDSIHWTLADGTDPAYNKGAVKAKDGSYVMFSGGDIHIGSGSQPLTAAAAKQKVDAYVATTEGQQVQRILTSLTIN